MTNEEKAEEYVKNRPFIHLLGRNTLFIQKEFKDAILWALAEGRKEKWHEIESHVTPKREISKKYMPKGKEKVLLKYHFYGEEEIHYSDGYYDPYDFEFHIPINPHGKIVCVIGWCELPKFEE